MPKIALLQMTSGIDPEENYSSVEAAAKEASRVGAEVLFTPEMSLLLDRDRTRAATWVNSNEPIRMREWLARLAAETGVDLAIGSMPFPADEGLWANRAFYFDATGAERATYDKMHMFDVHLSTGETWRESSAYKAGDCPVSIDDTPMGKLGLTICYDLRFPALFEELGKRRCDTIAVPAAFTKPTGVAHWHVMLRARAIEASAFVIAAAQVGKHQDGRETYGHSVVVDPWGEVLLDMGGEDAHLAYCDIDLERINEVRGQVPSLANKREIPN
ncbi:carbon-nitrogen hydrolase family protein [Erythrobacter sp. F6033]|uniref:carbon-nitrogen hydrolase family protein n=1 Tax=Erythrobacter sp. F6033 TaxID=2926401 RepID=UPI001FF57DEA|nr:carbon-nitrogen hydrolase family protein [Erythrobacter sp. F6033]MCK0128320.1 carbon-nitrogen hydrolase family protein [Erythrobacter sp. F6033]